MNYPAAEHPCAGRFLGIRFFREKPVEREEIADFWSDYTGGLLSRHYWHIERKPAASRAACGQCENACTRHINIIERLGEIAG